MRPRTILPSLIAVAVAAALWWADGDRSRRSEVLERSGPEPRADEAPGSVALSPVMGPSPEVEAPALTEAPATERTERVAAKEAEPVEAEAAIAPVMGVVVDAQGRPVAGVDVALTAWGLVDLDEDFEVVISSIRPNFQRRSYDVVMTDAMGAFLFEDSSLAEGGELTFARGRYLSGPRKAEVDTEATQQVLRLPDFQHQDSVWTIDVCTPDGDPLEISSAELAYRGGSKSASRMPFPSERTVEHGRIVQRGLPPGRWTMLVEVPGALAGGLQWDIGEPASRSGMTLVFEPLEGGVATNVEPTLDVDGQPWVDPGSGLLEWLPEERLAIGEETVNRHFAQTFQVGHGEVRAAQLTLRLRSIAHMSSNDGLYLEHIGPRKFAFGRAIKDLVGGSWEYGASATLRIDLSRAPGKDGEVDLLPYLADGTFDVVLQDDTKVEHASLRVIR